MAERSTSVASINFNPPRPAFPSPRDWRDQFIYQIMLDRYDDGKDHPAYDPKSTPRGRDRNEGTLFQGGTLKGITRRLDYLRNLGVTALWITPPFKNRQEWNDTYHGYGIQDFLAIDPRFGQLSDLQDLVRQAHDRGMYVILDIVINHTGNNWGYKNDENFGFNDRGRYEFGFWRRAGGNHADSKAYGPDDAVWPIELQNPDAYKRRGQIRNLSGPTPDERIHGDFFGLKELELNNPAVLDAIIKIHKYWIAIADVDGFRMDTVTNLDPTPTAIFCNAIREYAKRIGKHNFMIFGEIVGDDDLLKQYVGQNTPVPGTDEEYPVFDAALDFPLYGALEEVIKGLHPPSVLRHRYEHLRHYYRDYNEASRYYITFVDNHDQGHRPFRRFMSGARDPRQANLAIGYILTNMGIPCMYYGTEQGFDGGGDSDIFVRECMFGGKWGAFDTTGVHFFNDQHSIYRGIAAVAKVRADQPALRYGRQYFREISGNACDFGCPESGDCTLAFSRVLDTDEVLIAINPTESPKQDHINVDYILTPPGSSMRNLLDPKHAYEVINCGGRAAVQLPLGPREIAILKRI